MPAPQPSLAVRFWVVSTRRFVQAKYRSSPPVTAIYSGIGRAYEPDASPLSHIIERLNERFGLKLTEADRLHLDGIAQDLMKDEPIQRYAAANSKANFEVQFL